MLILSSRYEKMGTTNIKSFIQNLQLQLLPHYEVTEIRQFANLILEHLLGFTSTQVLTQELREFTNQELTKVMEITERLLQHEPIQYILGSTEFYNLKLEVNTSVLIPRPETEELLEWILSDKAVDKSSFLDIGTGSGCIALTLKSNLPNALVEAWDISATALEVATNNAKINQLEVTFNRVDVLNVTDDIFKNTYTCIVSNPPYIRELEKELMQNNVLNFEPHTALFVSNNDPLIFYRHIALLAQKLLVNKGVLFFEINEFLGSEMVSMLQQMNYTSIELRKDLSGKDRMVRAVWHH